NATAGSPAGSTLSSALSMRTRTAKTPRTAVARSVATTTRRGCRASQAATRSIAGVTIPKPAVGPRAARDARSRYMGRVPAPRASVLLPARDATATLPAALESLRRQTMADWECVLVDDGSRDETGGLAGAGPAADAPSPALVTPRRRRR